MPLPTPPHEPSWREPPSEPPSRGLRWLVLLFLCVLLAATPLLLKPDLSPEWTGVGPRLEQNGTLRSVRQLAHGDLEPLRHWVERQKGSQLLIYSALAMAFTVYVVLKR